MFSLFNAYAASSLAYTKSLQFPDLAPVRLTKSGRTDMTISVPCDIPCQQDSVWWTGAIAATLTALDVQGANKVLFSMEGEGYYPWIIQKKADTLALVNYRFTNEVHLTYWHIDMDQQRLYDAQPVKFATATKKVLWVASNCHTLNNREAKITELEAEGLLDSDGACLHNHEATSKSGRRGVDKAKEMHQYLFYAAFENQNVPDYVTEKLFDAFQAGTVPVVYGAPNMPELVPKEWYIWVNDFSSTKELAEYLRKVSLNETLYMQYQNARMNVSAWPKWFVQKWSFTHSAECRLCRFVAAHREPDKYAFDPTTQELRKREAQKPRSHQDNTTIEEAPQNTNHKRESHPPEAQGIHNLILDSTGNHTLWAKTPQQAAETLRLYGVILVVLGLLAVKLAYSCVRRKNDDYTSVESNV